MLFASPAAAQDAKVLVLHPDPVTPLIDAGLDTLADAADAGGFEIDTTSSGSDFTVSNLSNYKAVVFLNNPGNTLNASQEAALQGYIQGGGGFVGIGTAAEAEPGVTFIDGLIGARPSGTAAAGSYTVVAGDRVHPASRAMPLTSERTDAYYTWQSNPTGSVHALLRVRSGQFAGDGTQPSVDRPIAWCRDFQGGRSVYTGLGRMEAAYDEDLEKHLMGAIQWAAGLVRGNCKATINSYYSSTKLTTNNSPATALNQSGEPHGLSIAENGWIIYIGRANCGNTNYNHNYASADVGQGCGTVHVWDPEQQENNGVTTAAIMDVFGNKGGGGETGSSHKIETGLLGVAVAPDFTETGHVYFYYYPSFNPDASPQGLPDGATRRVTKMQKPRISRFTMDLETKQLDLDSEVIILDWESQIYSCCHRGGGMGFDSEGNLYVTTGDNNSSAGNYSGNWQSVRCPTGDPGQATSSHCGSNNISYRDARRTAGNTNDLNGKMLRINPIDSIPDGEQPPIGVGTTYTLPDEDSPNGPNLFTGDEGNGSQARPEIYAMGLRNPSRLNIDPNTDVPYSAWVGPDAGGPDPTLGPAKYEEFAAIPQAGNYGWPYCMGNHQAYRDRLPNDSLRTDTPAGYETGGSGTGGWYDCDNPRNDSTNNTGLVALPPVTPVNLWYGPGGGCPDFARTASGVPTYSGTVTQRCPYANGGGSQAIMSGPVYGYDDDAPEGGVRWPEYWEHRPIVVDHYNSHVRHALLLDPETAGEGGLPVWADNMKSIIPANGNYMDSKFGPDGALYVQSYGGGFFTISGNYGIWRVACNNCADTPGPDPQVEGTGGVRTYQFSVGASGGVSYEWDFGDGESATGPNPTHAYEEDGTYKVTLTVTYADGEEASKTIELQVFGEDNEPPTVSHTLNPPEPNGPAGAYRGTVTVTLEADDGTGSGVQEIQYRVGATGPFQTYDGPIDRSGNGQHRIQYRARDNAGNVSELKQVVFRINNIEPATTCFLQSDEFDGEAVDSKWEIVRPDPTGYSIVDGHLRIRSDFGDMSGSTNNAKNVFLQEAPDSDTWTFTAKIDVSELDQVNDQVGIIAYRNESPNNYAKFVWNRRSASTFWIERRLAVNGSSGGVGNGNTAAMPDSTDEIYLRYRYDEGEITGEYSLDAGENWTQVTDPFSVQGEAPLKIGVVAFQSVSATGDERTAGFDWVRVQSTTPPDGELPVCEPINDCLSVADEFDGDSLDPKWTILRPNPNPGGPPVSGGAVRINLGTGSTDMIAGTANTQNVLTHPIPPGPFTATAKLDPSNINANGEQAGLILWKGESPNHFVKITTIFRTTGGDGVTGLRFERAWTNAGSGITPHYQSTTTPTGQIPEAVYVQLIRHEDGTFTNRYSLDGENFQPMVAGSTEHETWSNMTDPVRIGLLALRGSSGGNDPVPFDWIHVVPNDSGRASCQPPAGDLSPPTTTANLNPEEPNGENGWYTGPVEVALTADDGDGLGISETEYRIGTTGEFNAYTGPFEVTGSGQKTVEFRSIDNQGNLEPTKSVTFRIDDSAPETTANLNPEEPNGPDGGYDGPVEVDFDAVDGDGESGVDFTEFRVDGGEWQKYVEEEVILGTQASDLNNWLQAGPGNLVHNPAEGGFFRTQGGLGMKWYPKEYGDFRLRLQWRDSSSGNNGNGGVFVRFPDPRIPLADRPTTGPGDWEGQHCSRTGSAASAPEWVAIMCGHEIQINDYQSDTIRTGSVYLFDNLNAAQGNPENQPRGTWVDFEIKVEGQLYTISRNGQVINVFNNADPTAEGGTVNPCCGRTDPPTTARQFERGFIGLQNHGNNDLIDYRNVRVLPLEDDGVQGPIVVEGEGEHTVEFRSTDVAGNEEETKQVTFRIGADEQAPTTTASVDPEDPDGNDGWYVSEPQVTLEATDGEAGSGVDRIEYRIGTTGSFETYEDPFTVPGDGARTVQFRAVDGAGNTEETQSLELKVDPTAPTTTAQIASAGAIGPSSYARPVTVTLSGNDGSGSGVDAIEYSLDGEDWSEYTEPLEFTELGEYTIHHRSTDVAGNVEEAGETSFEVAEGLPALSVKVKPKRKGVKRKRGARFTVTVRSTGSIALSDVKVCAKVPKRKLKVAGKRCRTFASIAPDAAKNPKFRVKVKPNAKGRARVVFNVTASGLAKQKAKAVIKVKK